MLHTMPLVIQKVRFKVIAVYMLGYNILSTIIKYRRTILFEIRDKTCVHLLMTNSLPESTHNADCKVVEHSSIL